MAKTRLDLMVDERTKRVLQEYAKMTDSSMSEVVDDLIIESLAGGNVASDAAAVMDMLWIQRLQDKVGRAIAYGTVYPFDEYCRRVAEVYSRDGDKGAYEFGECAVTYVPEGGDGTYKGMEIILDSCVDEQHDDIVSTANDVLQTVDAYVIFAEDDDGLLSPYGMSVVPKGRDRNWPGVFDWAAGYEYGELARVDSAGCKD